MIKDITRVEFGKILQTNKRTTIVAATNKINATIERPDDGVVHPEQYNPYEIAQLGVANEITQKRAAIAVITAVIISRIFSLICIVLVRCFF